MLILALETAVDPGSVALWRDGKIVARHCPDGRSNSETLLPLAAETLRENGLAFADLQGIAFGMGPGSFTGLRVSCGAAQGLAAARDLPLIGIVTLEAMALASGGERIIVALDARMGEVYYGLYVEGRLQGEIGVYSPESVPLPESSGWLACGNGLSSYPALRERLASVVNVWRPEIMPSAEAVVRLAAPRLARGESIDAADAAPLYVRNKVAQTVAERLAIGGRA
ncbi:MAG: tRNA (adenosine(37)-N6)-threonylcarbamoyltransferase complex dimerization subunit type 1 TsaB [Propionivibrio sp.]